MRTAKSAMIVLSLACFAAPGRAQFEIDWSTIDGGGGTSTGGEFSLSGTVGQPDAGTMTGGIFELVGGFWAASTPAAGGVPGDLNCDGSVTVTDIGAFVLALTNPAGYAAQFPNCNIQNADTNNDGAVTVSDIGPFVSLLTGG